jgi:hypothetical protein
MPGLGPAPNPPREVTKVDHDLEAEATKGSVVVGRPGFNVFPQAVGIAVGAPLVPCKLYPRSSRANAMA